MERTYELWDVDASNIIGTFSTDEEAIGVVKALLDAYGPDYANELSLFARIGTKQARIVASGAELIALTRTRPVRLS